MDRCPCAGRCRAIVAGAGPQPAPPARVAQDLDAVMAFAPDPDPWQLPASLASMMIRRCGRLSHAKCPTPDASRCGAARCWCCWRCCLSACYEFRQERQVGRVLDVLGISRGTGAGDSAAVSASAVGPAAPVTPPIAADAGAAKLDADGANRGQTHRASVSTGACDAGSASQPRLTASARAARSYRRPPACNRAAAPRPPRPQRAWRSNMPRAPRPARARSAVRVRSSRCTAACKCSAASPSGHRMPNVNACVPPIASTDVQAAALKPRSAACLPSGNIRSDDLATTEFQSETVHACSRQSPDSAYH